MIERILPVILPLLLVLFVFKTATSKSENTFTFWLILVFATIAALCWVLFKPVDLSI